MCNCVLAEDIENTVAKCEAYSPAQLLMSRMLSKLPIVTGPLKCEVASGAYSMLKTHKQKQKEYFDRGSRSLPKLSMGCSVRVRFRST